MFSLDQARLVPPGELLQGPTLARGPNRFCVAMGPGPKDIPPHGTTGPFGSGFFPKLEVTKQRYFRHLF